ncbi:hypothetical protein DSM106972_086850 [Dulcicalothrix desertica PCC 7102]|uniref:Peptidase C-terminal archaeal/bacterial domain-containing protein n=1 Tax=Dulcicalothrix desertica PCC 7102 TaxID=232991 RepID=A0A433US30_9CYAN|nr:hypothetical protein [Dulcicalothrix desertica]RUS96662.1 hypothetical protein DSM106972_086850 [Dulcicalothrix desertica PCC 7102]TWH54866.1 hypothetical protein CAL7102_02942 [Dulcicalothrix desertica PCC 7102]
MRSLLIAGASSLLLTLGMSSIPAPSFAQTTNIQDISRSVPRARVTFAKGKSSTVINGVENRVYVLKAKAGQKLTLKANNLGARAAVTLYNANGKIVKSFNGFGGGEGQSFTYRLPATGDYYIFGYAGPTYHSYEFAVSIK